MNASLGNNFSSTYTLRKFDSTRKYTLQFFSKIYKLFRSLYFLIQFSCETNYEKRENLRYIEIDGRRNDAEASSNGQNWGLHWYTERLLLKKVNYRRRRKNGQPSAFLFTGSLSRNYAAFIWRRRERRKTRGHLSTEKLFFGLTGGDKSVETRAFPARLSDIARFLTARYHTSHRYIYVYIYSPLLFFLLTPPFFRETRLGYCTISAIHTRIVSCRGRVEIAVERRLSSIVNFQTIISQQCHWLPLRGNTEVIAIAVVQRLALNLISNALSPRAYVDPSISIVWRNPTRLCATINYRWQIQIRWIRIGWTAYFVDYRIATAICISSRQSVRSLRPIETAMMNRRPTYRMIEESLNFTGWSSRGGSTPGLSSLNFTEDLWETMMQDWQIAADHD